MIEIVDEFLKEYNLNNPDKTFLVGFSGGCDSLCLLDILNVLSKKYGYKVIALHLNHNWRGEESLSDEANCRDFCEKNSIEFVSETLISSHPKTELAARDARYNFFVKYAKNFNNSAIFTGHTRSDNAETIVYRIIKGTGIKGIQGILPERNIEGVLLYRPILKVSRADTENYCISKGLIANNDSSNADTSYKRNFIRHKIMPLFKEVNYNAEKAINSLSKIAKSNGNIVEEYISIIKKDILDGDKILSQKFINLSRDVMGKLVYDYCIFEKLEYDYKKILNILDFILDNIDSKSGSRYSLSSHRWLFVSSKYIYIITDTKGTINDRIVQITGEGEYQVDDTDYIFSVRKFDSTDKFSYPLETDLMAYVDLSNVGLNLTVRTRRDGDHISPFGMTGTMKLKKYLNSKGVFQHQKDGLILLCDGSEVLWVCSLGLSNKLRVDTMPTHVLELKKR